MTCSKFLLLIPLLGIGFCLFACVKEGNKSDAPRVEYQGQGQYNVPPPPTTLQGTVKARAFEGGKIQIEARRSVLCEFGHCPVVGSPPVGSETLNAPGPYALELPESAKDLIIIATYESPSGTVRIAHTFIQSEATELSGIDLSLDRPYPPLR